MTLLASLDGGQHRFFQRLCQDLAKRNEFTTALARKLEGVLNDSADTLVRTPPLAWWLCLGPRPHR